MSTRVVSLVHIACYIDGHFVILDEVKRSEESDRTLILFNNPDITGSYFRRGVIRKCLFNG